MAEQRMVDLGNRLTAIGMTMQDYFDLDNAESRARCVDTLRHAASLPKNAAHRQTLMEIADALAEK